MKPTSPQINWTAVHKQIQIAKELDAQEAASWTLVYNRASDLEQSGQHAAAAALFRQLLSLTKDAEVQAQAHYHLGRIAKSAGDSIAAADHFSRSLALNHKADKAGSHESEHRRPNV